MNGVQIQYLQLSRNEITDIQYGDVSPEEKIIRSMEVMKEAEVIQQLFRVTKKQRTVPCTLNLNCEL